MEEDALNQPTAAGEMLSAHQITLFSPHLRAFNHLKKQVLTSLCPLCYSSLEADLFLHMLSESPSGALVVYVIPESSSLLPEVKTFFFNVLMNGGISIS